MTSPETMRKFRAELTAMIPWVKVVRGQANACTALTSKYWKLGYKTRRDMSDDDKAKYRCSMLGLYRFRPLKDSMSMAGTYCEIHLRSAGIFGSMEEDARYQKWCRRNAVKLNLLRVKYGLTPIPVMPVSASVK